MIEENLLKNRIIFLNGEVNSETSYDIITKLLYLDSLNQDDISLYINSPGGSVREGLAIIDCMNTIKSNIATYCIGSSYSMGAIILSSGTIGKRYALPNSEIMIHSPSTNLSGKAEDISSSSKRLDETKNKLIEILSKNTKKNKKTINKYFKDDTYMNSDKALEFGIIDKIIKSSWFKKQSVLEYNQKLTKREDNYVSKRCI